MIAGLYDALRVGDEGDEDGAGVLHDARSRRCVPCLRALAPEIADSETLEWICRF